MNQADSQLLHSENFDLCRVCLLEPESNRSMAYYPIFGDDDHSAILRQKILELLQIKIERNDVKPKIICSNCRNSILTFSEMKKKATEAQIVVNYIAKKRFGPTTLNQTTSDAGSSSDSKNNTVSTTAPQIPLYPQTPQLKLTYPSETRPVSQSTSYTGSRQQDCSTVQPFIANHSTPVAAAPVAAHESDDNASCHEVHIPNEVIYVSSDSDDYEDNFKRNPSDKDVVRYCSICKVNKKYNHECSSYNKEFSTCLVPNCNILFRKLRDFDPHYRQHIGFSPREWICRRCFKENRKSERDVNGRHICRNTESVFKCYTCNTVFNSMPEFASHKLQKHKGRLINSSGNYLCFYCEKSSPNMTYIDQHTKEIHYKKNQNDQENTAEYETKPTEPKVSETLVTTNDKNVTKKTVDPGTKNVIKSEHSYKLLLFTCLKQSCNLVFQHFPNFKFHHRQHFNTGNSVMCWQCCTPFASVTSLRTHQVKDNCKIPGMFKCHECPEVFDDIESFSVHKYTIHNGQLVIQKRGLLKKTAICPSCRSAIKTANFRSHLIQCYTLNSKSSDKIKSICVPVPKLVLKKTNWSSSKCGICGKVCLTAAALSSHIKIHNPNRTKKLIRKKVNTKNFDLGFVDTNKKVKQIRLNQTPSSSFTNNETLESVDLNTGDVANVVSSTSSTCKTDADQRFVDYDKFPFSNGVYSCIQCPRQFTTKMGLAKHWPFCNPQKMVYTKISAEPKNNLPVNYYCTDCKEYFTRVGFGSHFKIAHGKKLGLNKNKRFSCTKCPFKFLYKVALLMHYQHVHGELANIEQNTTGDDDTLKSDVNDLVNFPVVSETTSLATDYAVDEIEESCDQRIKEEINNIMSYDVQWENDGLGSCINGQDESNINEELVNGDMSNAQGVTQNVEIEEEQQQDIENAMEVDNTNEIEKIVKANELGEKCIESRELNESNEVNRLEKNNEADKLGENGEANGLDKDNEANCREETGNIEVTTTSNGNIDDAIIIKKEFILNNSDKMVEEVNETQNIG